MSADENLEQSHRVFSADCFNTAWEFIEKPDRTPDEDEQMIHLAHASVWHWTQREDCEARNLSIGYWQLSRVYSLCGRPEEARRYGHLCLNVSPQDDDFCLGYAHEALARAEQVADEHDLAAKHVEKARTFAENVTDEKDRKYLLDDLDALSKL